MGMMRRVLILAAVLVGAAPSLQSITYACGDKFLLVGRGARFNQVYAAIYPATILLYSHSSRSGSAAILDPKFQASLTRAGHRLQVVKDEDLLAQTLQAGRFDLVLVEVADVEAIKPHADQSPSKPTVLPVMYQPTKAEAQAVKARYQCELKSSDRAVVYLKVIDGEMQARVKLRAARKTP
jgi:hypothetical protein